MCRPDAYQIRWGSNPVAAKRTPIDAACAIVQWERLRDAIRARGVEVVEAVPGKWLTGMVFAAEAGIRLPTPIGAPRFMIASMSSPHRRGEAPLFALALAERGYRIETTDCVFEGEGDCIPWLVAGVRRWIAGFGIRSDVIWLERLEGDLGSLLPLRLIDPRFFHANTVACVVGETLLLVRDAIDPASLETWPPALRERIVPLSSADALALAPNSLIFRSSGGLHALVSHRVPAGFVSLLQSLGAEVEAFDLDEFTEKGGGGPQCLVCRLEDER